MNFISIFVLAVNLFAFAVSMFAVKSYKETKVDKKYIKSINACFNNRYQRSLEKIKS